MATVARPQNDDEWLKSLPAPQIGGKKKAEEFSEVGKAVRSFGQETQALGGGVVALGAAGLQAITPDAVEPESLENARKWGMEVYERNTREAQAPELLPSVARIEDIDLTKEGGVGRLADWAAFHGTKGLGTVATIAAGGGVGGAVAKGLLKQGIKKAAKDALKTKAQREILIGQLGPKEAAKKLAGARAGQKEAAEEVLKAQTKGRVAGATGTAFGMEAGSQFGQTVSEGVAPQDALLPALGVGAVNAALELTPWGVAAKYLGMGRTAKEGIKKAIKADKGLRRRAVQLAKGAAAGVAAEGLTEGLQELVGLAGERWAKDEKIFEKLSPEDISQIKNAMAVGGLVGGGLGGAVGPFKGRLEDQTALQNAVDERVKELQAEGVAEDEARAQASREVQEEIAQRSAQEGQRAAQEEQKLGERIQPGEGLAEGQQRVDAFRTPAERQVEIDRQAGPEVAGEVFNPVTGLQRPPQPQVNEEVTPGVPPLEQAIGETWAQENVRPQMLNAMFGQGAVEGSPLLQEAASLSWEEIKEIPELHDALVAQAAGQAQEIQAQTAVPTPEELEQNTAQQVREELSRQGVSLESLTDEQRAAIDASLGDIPSTLRPQAGFDQKEIEQAIQRRGRRRSKPEMIVGNQAGAIPEGAPNAINEGPQAESVGGQVGSGVPVQAVREILGKTFKKDWIKKAEQSGFLKITEGLNPGNEAARARYNFDGIEIFAGALDVNSPWDAILLHEGTHAGFQEILGTAAPQYTKEIEQLAESGKSKAAKAAMGQARAVAEEKGRNQAHTDAIYTEELPAYFVQYAREGGAGQGIVRRIINNVKAWFAQTEFGQNLKKRGLGFELTDEMAIAIAKQSTQLGMELRELEGRANGGAELDIGSLEARIPVQGRDGMRVSVLDDASPQRIKFLANVAESQHEGPYFEGVRILRDPRYGIDYAWPANSELLHADVADAVGIDRRRINIMPYSEQALNKDDVDRALQQLSKVTGKQAALGSEARTPRLQPTQEEANREVFKPKLMDITEDYLFGANDDTLGRLAKLELGYVDRFAGLKKQSPDVVREMDLAQTKGSSVVADLEQDHVKPLEKIFTKNPKLKIDEIGEALAARHIVEDRVNENLSERASEDFIKDLLPNLSKTDAKELAMKQKELVKDSKISDEARRVEMKKLMDDYVGKEVAIDGVQEVKIQWEEFKDHSGGMSTGGGTNTADLPDAIKAYDKWKEDKDFKEIVRIVDELNRKALQYRVQGDLITQADHDRLLKDKPHYMPLRREGFDYEQMIAGKGTGTGKGLSTRVGSANHKPVHVIQNALAKAQAAAIAAQNNLARQFMAKQIQENPKAWKGWFEVRDGISQPKMNKQGFTGETEHSLPDMGQISFVKDGKRLLIVPEGANQRATSFVRAVNNLDAKEVEGPMKLLQFGNRIIRFMNITASPAFLVANAIRDPLTAAYNLKATEADGQVKEIFKEYGNSFRALRKTMLGNARETLKEGRVPDADALKVKRWEDAGGRISFTQALKEMDTSAFDTFEKRVKRGQAIGPKSARAFQAGKQGLEFLENSNMVMENIMRLSAFTVLTRPKSEGGKGLSEKEAAQISKDMTTNFTRRGYKSAAMGTWWLFFNATIQGNRQVIVNAMKSPKLQGMIGGTMVFSAMIDAMGRAIGEDDEDGDGKNDWDAIPHYEKERYIHFPVRIGGNWLKIPSPWVYNVVWRAGQAMGEVAAGVDGRDIGSAMTDLGRMSISTLNPVAGGTPAQTLAPTALDPLVQIWENRDFAGNPLGPADYAGDTRPDSQRAWATTPKQFKWAAKALNEATGGSTAESGLIDVRPSTLKVLHDTFGGGLARFFQRLGGASWDKAQGKDTEVSDWPIARQFAAVPRDTLGTQLYHERQAEVNKAVKGLKRLTESGPDQNLREAREFRRDKSALLRMDGYAKDVDRQIKGLRKQVREAQIKGLESREEMLQKRIKKIQTGFNTAWKKRVSN